MSTFEVILLMGAVFSVCLLIQFLDAKYQLRLNDWLSGECVNPFKQTVQSSQSRTGENEKDMHIKILSERVATLEKIVTEPAYELNKKINQL